MKGSHRYILSLALGLVIAACSGTVDAPPDDSPVKIPAGFPQLPVPADNKITPERIALGKKLFFDKRLSSTHEVSCGSCHLQEHAFADPRTISIGVHGRVGTRNAPMLVNMAYNTSFFWDGGVPTLEQQAIVPILNPLEMDMRLEDVAVRLKDDAEYVELFRQAYDMEPKAEGITKGLATFIRTLVSGNSRYDRYQRGENGALNESEKRGMELFLGESGECFHCHVGFNFTNNNIQNNGLYLDYADQGRYLVTENPRDIGKFKVPSLRNVAVTAPYMHDGSLATLEEVVEHYVSGGVAHPNADPIIHPLRLDEQDKADLVAFLKSLTDEEFLTNPKFRE